ncbi:hypothetical protein PQR75_27600 [Paraburkholderia fungorum]
MKTIAENSVVTSFGSWLRNTTAVARREWNRALELHLQNCEIVVEAYRRK